MFQNRHKSDHKDFARQRKLSFPLWCVFQLQKCLKSLQLRLNKLYLELFQGITVTETADSQVRAKLRHTSVIELSDCINSDDYQQSTGKKWQGYRLLAIGGSQIILPDSKAVKR